MNNIQGGGGRRQVLSSMDFYRRVPKDLTEVRAVLQSCLCVYIHTVSLSRERENNEVSQVSDHAIAPFALSLGISSPLPFSLSPVLSLSIHTLLSLILYF
jgi:hypothetical protein